MRRLRILRQQKNTHSISGVIRDAAGQPMTGVSVNVNSNSGFSTSVETDASGYYQVDGLDDDLYLIYSVHPGFTIQAEQGNVFVYMDSADINHKDFIASAQNYSISGLITDDSGMPMSGVAVMVNDNSGFASEVITNQNGYYIQAGLANGLYIVFPSLTGYIFNATEGNVFQNIDNENVTGKDYIGLTQ